MSKSDQERKRKTRWLRFSLRTFLIVVVVLGIFLGWYAYRVERQKAAVAWVEANGGAVYYDFEFDSVVGRYHGQPPGPQWLGDLLGDDYLSSVVCVFVVNESADDLSPLLALRSLVYLDLSHTQIKDLDPLLKMTNLKHLHVENSNVTKAEIDQFQKALPDCKIYHDFYEE